MLGDALHQGLNAVHDSMTTIQVLWRLIPELLEFIRVFRSQSRQSHSSAGHSCRPFPAEQEVGCRSKRTEHQHFFPILSHFRTPWRELPAGFNLTIPSTRYLEL